MSIKDQIEASQTKSLVYLDAIRTQPDDMQAVYDNLTLFVLHRFFLTEEAPDTDDIMALSKLSTDKLLEVNRKGELQSLSNNCAGVSSDTLKKALLIMTLQKQLAITFDPLRNETIGQLAQTIVEELGGGFRGCS